MIFYTTGDATELPNDGKTRIVAHIVNDRAVWGAGFVLAVSRRWPLAREEYMARSKDLWLGRTQLVKVETEVYVANMCAQEGFGGFDGPPIRYEALADCLADVGTAAHLLDATIHCPRIGCGLAGGTWDRVLPILAKATAGVNVYVYDLPESEPRRSGNDRHHGKGRDHGHQLPA